jgi:signal peptidase II
MKRRETGGDDEAKERAADDGNDRKGRAAGDAEHDRAVNPAPDTRHPTPDTRPGWRVAYLLAAAGLFLADQATKAWAVRRLRLGRDIEVIPGLLDFAYAENTGVAFGQLQDGGAWGRWLLVALAGAATVAVLTYFFRTPRKDDRVLGACALLLAGIVGNVTDRVRLGHVVDFISLHAGPYHWPTFNVADASICVGAGLLALDLLLEGRRQRARAGGRGGGVGGQEPEANSS